MRLPPRRSSPANAPNMTRNLGKGNHCYMLTHDEVTMRDWDTIEGLSLLERVMTTLRESKFLGPNAGIAGDPVDLRGLTFPTVALCAELQLSTVVASRVSGRQEFSAV